MSKTRANRDGSAFLEKDAEKTIDCRKTRDPRRNSIALRMSNF
jgi:hypothetical protein